MKKKISKVLMGFFLVFFMTGCVKFNANMNIKKDKSMDFEIIYAFDTTYFGDEELLTEEDKKEMEAQGFKVSDYKDGSMVGFTLTKNIKNIDKVSSDKDTEYSLSGLVEGEESSEYVFKVKKGFFKNTYTAKFNFDSSDSSLNDSSVDDSDSDYDWDYDSDYDSDSDYDWDYDSDYDSDSDYDWDYDSDYDSDSDYDWDYDSDYDSDQSSDFSDDYDYSAMMSSMDLSFNVTLPYKAISNNATSVSDNGKTLTWSLTTDSASAMEFEFALYNMTNIYICAGIALVIIAAIVFFIVKKRGKKSVNTGYTSFQVTSHSDMTQNIGKDVYQSSLQSVQNTVPVQPQPVQQSEIVSTNSSVNEVSQVTESTIQNSVSDTVQTSSAQEAVQTDVNVNSNNQNLN